MAGCPGQNAIRQSRVHVLHLSIICAVHLDVVFFLVHSIRYRDGHRASAGAIKGIFCILAAADGGGNFVDWVASLCGLVLQLDDHAGGLITLGRLGRHIVPGCVADGQGAHVGFQLDFFHILILIDGGQGIGTHFDFSFGGVAPTLGSHIDRDLAGISGDSTVFPAFRRLGAAVVAIYRSRNIAIRICGCLNLCAISNIDYILARSLVFCTGIAGGNEVFHIRTEGTAGDGDIDLAFLLLLACLDFSVYLGFLTGNAHIGLELGIGVRIDGSKMFRPFHRSIGQGDLCVSLIA